MEGWKIGGFGRLEGWKIGKVEDWKIENFAGFGYQSSIFTRYFFVAVI